MQEMIFSFFSASYSDDKEDLFLRSVFPQVVEFTQESFVLTICPTSLSVDSSLASPWLAHLLQAVK